MQCTAIEYGLQFTLPSKVILDNALQCTAIHYGLQFTLHLKVIVTKCIFLLDRYLAILDNAFQCTAIEYGLQIYSSPTNHCNDMYFSSSQISCNPGEYFAMEDHGHTTACNGLQLHYPYVEILHLYLYLYLHLYLGWRVGFQPLFHPPYVDLQHLPSKIFSFLQKTLVNVQNTCVDVECRSIGSKIYNQLRIKFDLI